MKAVKKKLSWLWLILISAILPVSSKAAEHKNIVSRINKLRQTLGQKGESGNAMKITGSQFHDFAEPGKWVNWGNWGNWNNWNNWANWSNWGNWGNWRNF